MSGQFNITDSGTQGATGAQGATGSTGTVTLVGNTYTVQTLVVSTLTVGTLGLGTIQSGNDLALKAAGQITTNAPFVLTTATTSTLATIAGITQRGAMVFATDALGVGQPVYYDGTYWWTMTRVRIY
jgi:hypothetical protein